MGLHRMAVLADTLATLDASLQALGSRLLVLRGPVVPSLARLIRACNARLLTAEEIAAPEEQDEIRALQRHARTEGWQLTTLWQSSLLEPDDLPFAVGHTPDVFTAFRQQVERAGVQPRTPLTAPTALPPLPDLPMLWDPIVAAQAVASPRNEGAHDAQMAPLCHTPIRRPTASVLPPEARSAWPHHLPACAPGEAGARAHVAQYMRRGLPHSYKDTRNGLIGIDFSSKLSPWLATGALSAPRLCRHCAHSRQNTAKATEATGCGSSCSGEIISA